MKTMSVIELKKKLNENNSENIQVIDIREPYEYEDGAISNLNIPLDKMMNSVHRISKSCPVVIYCQSGRRAESIIHMLEKEYDIKNLYNLEGGYTAFIEE